MALAVEYRGVTFAYPRPREAPRPALEGVTLSVEEGTRLGVLGPNGGGKSTLLKLTLGLLPLQQGEIRIFGKTVKEARRAGMLGYVPQRNEAELAFPLSVRRAVEMPLSLGIPPWRALGAGACADIDEALRLVGAFELAERRVGELSGGQLQRVMIARAIACKPRLLLLDEPTVGIDVSGQQQFGEMLTALHAALGLTVIVVSHDIRTVAAGCDRIACLSRTLHSHVSPEGLTPKVLAEVFRHDVAGIFGDVHVDAHSAASCTDPAHAPPAVSLQVSAKGTKER
ncbi:MAG: metal ABC transporter ATP-binding protein [Phycisphaerales bacterium]